MRSTKPIRYALIVSGLFCGSVAAARLNAAPLDWGGAQQAECLARTIQVTPTALRHARAGAWTQAVQLVGYQCDFSREASSAELPKSCKVLSPTAPPTVA